MMTYLADYCFSHSSSQRMSELRVSGGNYGTMLILRGVVSSSRISVETQIVIWMPPYDVL